MLPSLQTRFDALERRRVAFVEALRPLDEAERARKPAPGAWSLNELLHHLVLVDEGMVRSIRYYLGKPARPAGPLAPVRALLTRAVLASPLRIAVPQRAEGVAPRDTPDFEALCARWGAARDDLRAALEAVGPDRLRAAAFKHPAAGRFTLPGALDFVAWHQDHHRPQLARLLAAVRP